MHAGHLIQGPLRAIYVQGSKLAEAIYNFVSSYAQVISYKGRCEQFMFKAAEEKFTVDEPMQEKWVLKIFL